MRILIAAKTSAIARMYCLQVEAAKCQDHISIISNHKGVVNKSLHQIKKKHHDSSWDREFYSNGDTYKLPKPVENANAKTNMEMPEG